jgi:hypothetical protein
VNGRIVNVGGMFDNQHMTAIPNASSESLSPGSGPDPATLQALRERIRDMQAVTLGARTIPTHEALAPLLPGGAMKAGVAYSVLHSARLSLLLLAGASAAGAWCGVVGMPDLGIEAAAALGIDLDRLVLVPEPGEHWLTVAATLADVLAVVLVQAPPGVSARDADAARLSSRLRQRGATLVVAGPWQQAEAVLEVTGNAWQGLGPGHGYLAGSEAVVAVSAKGSRPSTHSLWLGTAPLARETPTLDRPLRLATG